VLKVDSWMDMLGYGCKPGVRKKLYKGYGCYKVRTVDCSIWFIALAEV